MSEVIVSMKAQKRNPRTKEYYPYEPGRPMALYTEELELEILCAGCAKKVKYGETYTSKEIHTEHWLWFPVCRACYDGELKRAGFM